METIYSVFTRDGHETEKNSGAEDGRQEPLESQGKADNQKTCRQKIHARRGPWQNENVGGDHGSRYFTVNKMSAFNLNPTVHDSINWQYVSGTLRVADTRSDGVCAKV